MAESIADLLEVSTSIREYAVENNTYLEDIREVLTKQFTFTQDLAKAERIRYEEEQLAAIERERESSRLGDTDTVVQNIMGDTGGGGLFGGLGDSLTGFAAGLGAMGIGGLFRGIVKGGLIFSLGKFFGDQIGSFLSTELKDIFSDVGVSEDISKSIRDQVQKNTAGVIMGAGVGSFFGLKGAIVGAIAGYVYSEFGLDRLLSEEGRKELQQELSNAFTGEDSSQLLKLGLSTAGIAATLGFRKSALALAVASFLYQQFDMNRLFSEEGREDIVEGLKQELQAPGLGDIGTAIGIAVGAVLARSLRGPGFSRAIKAALGIGATTAVAGSLVPSGTDTVPAQIVDQSKAARKSAALQVLTDEDLSKAGLVKGADGEVRQAAGQTKEVVDRRGRRSVRGIGGQVVGADMLEDVVRSSGREAQYNQRIFGAAARQATDPQTKFSLKKIAKFAKTAGGLGIIINGALLASIAVGPGSWKEKASLMAIELGGMGGAAIGALLGAQGGPVGVFIGATAGYYVGAKIIAAWLTSDSEADLTESDIIQAVSEETGLTSSEIKTLAGQTQISAGGQAQIPAAAAQIASDIGVIQQAVNSLPAGDPNRLVYEKAIQDKSLELQQAFNTPPTQQISAGGQTQISAGGQTQISATAAQIASDISVIQQAVNSLPAGDPNRIVYEKAIQDKTLELQQVVSTPPTQQISAGGQTQISAGGQTQISATAAQIASDISVIQQAVNSLPAGDPNRIVYEKAIQDKTLELQQVVSTPPTQQPSTSPGTSPTVEQLLASSGTSPTVEQLLASPGTSPTVEQLTAPADAPERKNALQRIQEMMSDPAGAQKSFEENIGGLFNLVTGSTTTSLSQMTAAVNNNQVSNISKAISQGSSVSNAPVVINNNNVNASTNVSGGGGGNSGPTYLPAAQAKNYDREANIHNRSSTQYA